MTDFYIILTHHTFDVSNIKIFNGGRHLMAQTGKARKPPKKSKSVLKRQRQNIKRRARNASALSALHTEIRKFDTILQKKEIDKAKEFLRRLVALAAHLSSRGILKKQTASRKISRLYLRFNKIFGVKAQ
ncbi:MAG: 30S ribosomal protein S20 [bacterium]